MSKQNVIAIFDVGKTNKKFLLFDEQYNILKEESEKFEEIKDEQGFPCENLQALTKWIKEKFAAISSDANYILRAVNFSAYGASLVHLDDAGNPLTPLYNYLKPFPENLKRKFYDTYGDENLIARQTASPVLGSLNSGMQLYRLKQEQPEFFSRVKYSLHLPQYLSFLLSSKKVSEITSIGCHTQLWDFQKNNYHDWVIAEGLEKKIPEIISCKQIAARISSSPPAPLQMERGAANAKEPFSILEKGRDEDFSLEDKIAIGTGLHDSSAALIPYLKMFDEPFILISTGTWCISLNPFNHSSLTDYELRNDCLCYLTHVGTPVKASRLFAGHEHEEQVKRLAEHFHKHLNYHQTIVFDNSLHNNLQRKNMLKQSNGDTAMLRKSAFGKRALTDFKSYEEAYHQLMLDLMQQQVFSTNLVLAQTPVKKIFVDGGFAMNDLYMHMLALSFPQCKIFSSNIAQASAIGSALVLHNHWNKNPLTSNLIRVKNY